MKKSEAWEHSQDIAKLFLATALLAVVSPETETALKIAPIAIGYINRAIKLSGIFNNKQDINVIMLSEQKMVFKKAWECTHASIDKYTQMKLCEQLEAAMEWDINELDSYTEQELLDIFEKAISTSLKYSEWYAEDLDFHNIYKIFMDHYDEEVLKTTMLVKYYNRNNIKKLLDITEENELRLDEHERIIQNHEKQIASIRKISHGRYITNLPRNTDKQLLHRSDKIQEILENINKGNQIRLLITGFGGIGKTFIAQYLFHCLKNVYKHIAWIEYHGSLKESLLGAFTIYPHLQDKEERFEQIMVFLNESLDDTILFLDDLNDADKNDLALLDGIGAKVILTSRAPEIRNYESIPIEFLSKDMCVDIFYQYYKFDKERIHYKIVRGLVDLVCSHTLSVQLLALSANRIDYDLEQYLEKLIEKGFQYPDLKVYTDHTKKETVIAEHLKMLFDMEPVKNMQVEILKVFSVMPSIEIPAEVREWLSCDINDLHELIKTGWISGSKTCYSMHSIVKHCIDLQYNINYDDCRKLMSYMAGDAYIKDTDLYTDAAVRLNIAHAFLTRFKCVEDIDFARFCMRIARVYFRQGDYLQAMEWNQKSLAIREKKLGKEHPDIAETYSNMAGVYYRQGDYAKAMEWNWKSLAIREKKLGREHPDTATIYNNIALVYSTQGDYAKAMEWNWKSLAIREKKLGKEHLQTAETYGNIALVYSGQGDYAKAMEWHQKALAVKEKVLGEEHPDTATIYNNIASEYSNQGDYAKAMEWNWKSLAIKEKVLGKEHPSTAITYDNIARVYSRQGSCAKAMEWNWKSLAIKEKVFGKENPNTAGAYSVVLQIKRCRNLHIISA